MYLFKSLYLNLKRDLIPFIHEKTEVIKYLSLEYFKIMKKFIHLFRVQNCLSNSAIGGSSILSRRSYTVLEKEGKSSDLDLEKPNVARTKGKKTIFFRKHIRP